jgi:hypothetical protein
MWKIKQHLSSKGSFMLEKKGCPQIPMTIMGHLYVGSKMPQKNSQIIKFKKNMGFDAEHWFGSFSMMSSGEGGDSGKDYLFKTQAGYSQDKLTDYLKTAHKQGHKFFVYFNVHWFKKTFGEHYLIRDSKGELVCGYGSGYLACPVGPFLDWSVQVARDLGSYAIDGIFLDGPIYSLCYCDSCRRQFKEKYGRDIPSDLTHLSKPEKKWIQEFPLDNFVHYLHCIKKAFNEKNPKGLVYHNGESLGSPGFANQAASKVLDMLGVEGGFIGYGPLKQQFFFHTSATVKLLESQSFGKPTVNFIDFGYKCYDYYSHTAPEIYRMYASTIANNANPWFVLYPNQITPGIQAGIEMNKFIQTHRKTLTGTKSLAKVALLYSGLNIHLKQETKSSQDDVHAGLKSFKSSLLGDPLSCFMGIYSALTRSRIPFDVVIEENLEQQLNRYEMLILPNVAAMNDATIQTIKMFVKRGGNLLATFDTSLYDENGDQRRNYGLSEVYGCSAGNLMKTSTIDYISAKKRNFLTRNIEEAVLPRPEYSRLVKCSRNKCQALIYYHEPMPRRYAVLTDVSEESAAILNKYGKGKTIFIPSNLGEHYLTFNFPQYRQMIENTVKCLSTIPVKIDLPANVLEVSLRENEMGERLLHLINLTSSGRPAEEVLSLQNIHIDLHVDKKIKNVYGAVVKKKLLFVQNKAQLSFTLPEIKNYEMIVVE